MSYEAHQISLKDITVRPIEAFVSNEQQALVEAFKNGPQMKVGEIPQDAENLGMIGIRDGETLSPTGKLVIFEGGVQMPFSIAEAPEQTVLAFRKGITKAALLDRQLKDGFSEMFSQKDQRDKAARYARYMFNVEPDQDSYVEELIATFVDNPNLCNEYAHSYRGDGRVFPDGRPGLNEVNSVPGGTCWMPTMTSFLMEMGIVSDAYDLEKLYPNMTDYLLSRADGKGIFFPALSLSKYKVLAETILWMKRLEAMDKESYVGVMSSLQVDSQNNSWVEFDGQTREIGYLDGLSNPETLRSRLDVLAAIRSGKLICPSFGDIIGISNKGAFVLLTSMREGRFPYQDFGLDQSTFANLTDVIPNTYWLEEAGSDEDRSDQFLTGNSILKPFNLVGGAGFIAEPTREDLNQIAADGNSASYLVQEKLFDFDIQVFTDEGSVIHRGSLDPYYQMIEGRSPRSYGFITRGSSEGVSNVSAHVSGQENKFTNHIAATIRQ